MQKHAQRLDLDTSHFQHNRGWTEMDLDEAVKAATNWAQVLESLMVSGGSSVALVKRHVARLGLDTSHFGRPTKSPPAGLMTFAPHPTGFQRAAPMLAGAWLMLCGFDVSWPLDRRPYDLIADDHRRRLRVRVQLLAHDVGRVMDVPEEPECLLIIEHGRRPQLLFTPLSAATPSVGLTNDREAL